MACFAAQDARYLMARRAVFKALMSLDFSRAPLSYAANKSYYTAVLRYKLG